MCMCLRVPCMRTACMKTKRPRVLACRRACAHNTLALRLHDERHARASHATGAHRVTRARCAPLRSPCKERCTTARRGTPCVAAVAPCRAQQAFPPPSSPTPSAKVTMRSHHVGHVHIRDGLLRRSPHRTRVSSVEDLIQHVEPAHVGKFHPATALRR